MTTFNTINYSGNSNYNRNQISASTKRKLESLGIDPSLVTSESHALSLIASRQSERSFEQYAIEKPKNTDNAQANNSTETDLISEAKLLAEQLGITVDNNMTFDEITTDIASVLNNMYNRAQNNPEELQKVQQYQNQLAQLTDNFDNASKSTSNLYSAMSLHANNTRFLLGL